MVNCVYVTPRTDQYWIIDYRLYAPDIDGRSKLDHVRDMLTNVVYHKKLPFRIVLMDTWYAARDLMLFIEELGKSYYCPLPNNRLVDDSGGAVAYQRVDGLTWDVSSLAHGKIIKIKGFPKDHKVKLFRVDVSIHRTDWVVTNDKSQENSQVARELCALRWKIEQFHRQTKQLTGIEKCQCRKARIQRNHITAAVLVWLCLTDIARKTEKTIYQVKHKILDEFLCTQLKKPIIKMTLLS